MTAVVHKLHPFNRWRNFRFRIGDPFRPLGTSHPGVLAETTNLEEPSLAAVGTGDSQAPPQRSNGKGSQNTAQQRLLLRFFSNQKGNRKKASGDPS